jgi:hypothetical protein
MPFDLVCIRGIAEGYFDDLPVRTGQADSTITMTTTDSTNATTPTAIAVVAAIIAVMSSMMMMMMMTSMLSSYPGDVLFSFVSQNLHPLSLSRSFVRLHSTTAMCVAVVGRRNGGGRKDVVGLGLCFSFLILSVVSADAPIRGQKSCLYPLKGTVWPD